MPEFLKRRIPAKNDFFLALSVATLLIFSWELRSLFYNAPAFFLSYTLWEFLSIAAYMLASALIETTLVVLSAAVLAIILPGVILRDGFAYKASFLFVAPAIVSAYLQFNMTNQPKINFLLMQLFIIFTLWLIPVLLIHFIAPLRKFMLDLFDRLTIFSYIYLPLGFVSLLVVIARLLW
jgi:hypothetical protein